MKRPQRHRVCVSHRLGRLFTVRLHVAKQLSCEEEAASQPPVNRASCEATSASREPVYPGSLDGILMRDPGRIWVDSKGEIGMGPGWDPGGILESEAHIRD